MKQFYSVALAALFITNLGLYAQEKDIIQTTPEIKAELVYQFDTTKVPDNSKLILEIKKALKEKAGSVPQEDIDWVLNKIRLDMVRQSKKLYTEKGEEIDIPYFGVGFPHSSDFKYFIFNTCDYSKRIAENPRSKLIRTSDGKIMWEIKTMMINAFVSNDGVTVVDATTALPPVFRNLRSVRFYNAKGSVAKIVDNLNSLPEWITMTNDGNICVIFDRKNRGTCIAYDSFGNEMWRKTDFCSNLTTMDFFNNNKFFLCSYVSNAIHTLLIDRQGIIVGDYNFAIREGSFSDDNKYLIFNVTRDSVHYLNIQSGEVIHEKTGNNIDGCAEYCFINLFDKLGIEGIVMLNKNEVIQGIYLKQGEASPNKHIIITPVNIQLLEVVNEE